MRERNRNVELPLPSKKQVQKGNGRFYMESSGWQVILFGYPARNRVVTAFFDIESFSRRAIEPPENIPDVTRHPVIRIAEPGDKGPCT